MYFLFLLPFYHFLNLTFKVLFYNPEFETTFPAAPSSSFPFSTHPLHCSALTRKIHDSIQTQLMRRARSTRPRSVWRLNNRRANVTNVCTSKLDLLPGSAHCVENRFVSVHSEDPSNGKRLHARMTPDKTDSSPASRSGSFFTSLESPMKRPNGSSSSFQPINLPNAVRHAPPIPPPHPLMCGSKVPLGCQHKSLHIGRDELVN